MTNETYDTITVSRAAFRAEDDKQFKMWLIDILCAAGGIGLALISSWLGQHGVGDPNSLNQATIISGVSGSVAFGVFLGRTSYATATSTFMNRRP